MGILLGVAAALGSLVYLVQKRRDRRGELRIEFENKIFLPGETVRGSVEIIPRESFQMNVPSLRVTCSVQGAKRRGKGTTNSLLVDQVIPLAPAKNIQAGVPEKFPFSFEIADVSKLLSQQQEEILALAPGALKGVAKAYLDLGKHRQRFSWLLSARLEAEGIDLWKNKTLLVK